MSYVLVIIVEGSKILAKIPIYTRKILLEIYR